MIRVNAIRVLFPRELSALAHKLKGGKGRGEEEDDDKFNE